MMAELYGGPLDGTYMEACLPLPPFLVLASAGQGLLYKPGRCLKCASAKGHAIYVFAGYSYAHEEEIVSNNCSTREYQA